MLRQVRSSIAADSNHALAVLLEEAVVRLEWYLGEGLNDPGAIVGVLKVLAQGLVAIPGSQRLTDTWQHPAMCE